MSHPHLQSRRLFLKLTATTSGLLFSGLAFTAENSAIVNRQNDEENAAQFPLLILHADNSITVINTRAEMGQGVSTSLTQLLFEDLDADWQQLKTVEQGWADDTRFGHQNTIGAISSLIAWNFHRQVGAKINLLLREAACKVWKLSLSEVKTNQGVVTNLKTGQYLTYGQLSKLVQTDLPKDKLALKQPASFSVIGQSKPRVDLLEKVNGTAMFGLDVNLPQLKVAVVARCPVFGGKVQSFDATEAAKIKGVQQIFAVPSGVAVVADNYWQAISARKLLQITWQEGDFATVSSNEVLAEFKQLLDAPGKVVKEQGDIALLDEKKERILTRDFEFPLVAHMTMEPMNCTVWLKAGSCEIWAPTQNSQDAQSSAAKVLSLAKEKVRVNMTYMGGGFGRRAQDDFIVEACYIAKKFAHPIKLVWSREDDIQHDFYRPLNAQRISVRLDNNKIYAWQHKVATYSTSPYHFSLRDRGTPSGDWVAYGGADSSLYQIENFQTQVHLQESPLTVGILRGISHGYTHFAIESVIDELAEQVAADAIDFRLAQITETRAIKVLQRLQTRLANVVLQDNESLGVAFGHEKAPSGPYQYYNAVAAIIERTAERYRVKRLIVSLDHGQVINPDGLLAQVQGSAVFAVSMMFGQAITLKNGRIEQSNFHDSPVARIAQSVEVDLLTSDSTEWPMGVGEKLQGTIQPAIANALYRATGQRITSLPVDFSSLGA
ncbi:xanthine dehydrogenase family protein molybdopterin-binding subunit [Thalassotalea marina]|uniref:Oxidoreductase n=1 Tax=Thalassotalea marina TaxID=1673741 RepID=A0A919EII9_9GAMM|nr:molybdopterin cofactor-binding domain-containing protein [Thalassotalea marina]GHF84620.1 oxidoreductase [Thalassotalea marina]